MIYVFWLGIEGDAGAVTQIRSSAYARGFEAGARMEAERFTMGGAGDDAP